MAIATPISIGFSRPLTNRHHFGSGDHHRSFHYDVGLVGKIASPQLVEDCFLQKPSIAGFQSFTFRAKTAFDLLGRLFCFTEISLI